MQISEALTHWRAEISSSKAASTARTYFNGVKVLQDHLAEQDLELEADVGKLTIQHFISAFAFMARQGFTRQTRGAYIAGIKNFVEYLIVQGHLQPDYADALRFDTAARRIMKRRSDRLPKTPPKGDAEKMVEAARRSPKDRPLKERDLALILFLYSSGCRVSEAISLTVGEFYMDDRTVLVTGKGDKQRKVFFSSETVTALEIYWLVRGWRSPGDPAFARHDRGAGKRHEPIAESTARNIVADVAALAGVENFTPHSFRHAFATRMLNETDNLALVQDLLGHSSPATTREYAKVYPEALRKAHAEVYG